MVDDQERLLRCLHSQSRLAQCGEGLRAIYLVHEMAVDVKQASTIRLFMHEVIVPDFLVNRERQIVPIAGAATPYHRKECCCATKLSGRQLSRAGKLTSAGANRVAKGQNETSKGCKHQAAAFIATQLFSRMLQPPT